MEHVKPVLKAMDIAKPLAKIVIDSAEEAGMSETNLDKMRDRMARWYKVVMAYEKDRREVRANKSFDRSTRDALLATMAENLDAVRVQIFGE